MFANMEFQVWWSIVNTYLETIHILLQKRGGWGEKNGNFC